MTLKKIKVKYGGEIAINPDHVIQIQPEGENDTWVSITGGSYFVSTLTFEETIKLLQEE